MRVLLTTDTVGGVWTFTRELAGGLLKAGHLVALVSFGRDTSATQEAWVRETQETWSTRFYFESSTTPLEWMDGNAQTFDEGAKVLRSVAARFRPDLLHASQFCWGALDLHTPTVITAHSDVLSWAEACRPSGLEDSDWLRTYVRLVTKGLAAARAIVAPTRWMAATVRRHFPVCSEVRIVANGVSSSSKEDHKPEARAMRALCVGRVWDEGKGMDLLAQGEWPMPVDVAGEVEFEGGQAKIAGVRALGMLGEVELEREMRATAVYICCSIYEPFGLAAVEAGLCGCAVVCRDTASLREVWGDAAIYFSDGSSLRMVLGKFMDDEELLARMQGLARNRAGLYTVAAMVEGYLQVYADVVRSSNGTEGKVWG